jgi:hypothetical protein
MSGSADCSAANVGAGHCRGRRQLEMPSSSGSASAEERKYSAIVGANSPTAITTGCMPAWLSARQTQARARRHPRAH